MASTEQEVLEQPQMLRRRKEDRVLETLAGGSITKAVGGVAAIVLTIIGLAGVYPPITLGVAIIAVGASLLFEGAAITARYSKVLPKLNERAYETVELGGGMTTEFMAGAAGIVLGILALLGVMPVMLAAVSAIVFGAGLVLGGSIPSRLSAARFAADEGDTGTHTLLREAASAATGANVLVGIGAIVLGILALVGVGSASILSLVAILSIGFSVLLSGTTVSSRMMSLLVR